MTSAVLSGMKGLDTSAVEVDDDQAPPTILANSPEERSALAEMDALLPPEVLAASPEAQRLMCLRGRKYSPTRAAVLLPKMLAMLSSLELDPANPGPKLLSDLKSLKVVNLPSHDTSGRGLIWLRLRNHRPSLSTPEDFARCVAFVVLRLLSSDPEVQRRGVTVVNDLSGLSISNLQPSAAKLVFSLVFPSLPVRVGRVCVFNPPFIVGSIILPVMLRLVSSKLRKRVRVLSSDPIDLEPYVLEAQRPRELGGSMPFDEEGWAAGL